MRGSVSSRWDTLTGDAGPNVLHGLAGDDTVSGSDGDDTLIGDEGTETRTKGTAPTRAMAKAR